MRDSVARQKAREAWGREVARTPTVEDQLAVDDLVERVAEIHGAAPADVGDTDVRRPEVVRSRHALWWLLRQAGWSYPQCAEVVDGDRSTVYSALERPPLPDPCSEVVDLVPAVPPPEKITTRYAPSGGRAIPVCGRLPPPLKADDRKAA